jgi:hypothetical protein
MAMVAYSPACRLPLHGPIFRPATTPIGIEPEFTRQSSLCLTFNRLNGNKYPGSGIGLPLWGDLPDILFQRERLHLVSEYSLPLSSTWMDPAIGECSKNARHCPYANVNAHV